MIAAKRGTAASLLSASRQVGVGVHDGLSAALAARHGFDFLWVGSFSMSSVKGLPDAGLLTPNDVLSVVLVLARFTNLPIVVDLEAGYGDPVKLYYQVRDLVRIGISAVCIEDNPIPKRSSLYRGFARDLASVEEHVARVRACRVGIRDEGAACGVIARTEALVADRGVSEAISRAHAYLEAGADAIFAQSVDSEGSDAMEFCRLWKRRTPVFLTPTRNPAVPMELLFRVGASHIIFANHALRAACRAIDDVFSKLRNGLTGSGVEDEIAPVEEIAALARCEDLRTLQDDFVRRR